MYKSTSALPVFLLLFLLTGCAGAKFTGTLNENGNGSPTPPPGTPSISSISPSSAPAGAPAFTLTVNGSNFVTSTSVLWNDVSPLPTTYVSSTQLQAQVPASFLAKPGFVTIIVSPQVSLNFGSSFTITTPLLTGNPSYTVAQTSIQANDMVFDPVSQKLFLSVSSADKSHPSAITALDPGTGQLGTPYVSSTEPQQLSISSDGTLLYAGLDSAGTVQRFTLPDIQPDISVPLGSYSFSSVNYGPDYAISLAADPVSPHTIAVVRGNKGMNPAEVGGVVLYDDAAPRPQSVPGYPTLTKVINRIAWNPNGSTLYGIGGTFFNLSVSSTGVQLATLSQTSPALTGSDLHFDATTGDVYTDGGNVIDPATGASVGSFPLATVQGGFNFGSIMVPDGKLNLAYFVGQTAWESGTSNNQNVYVIEAYDLTHFTYLGSLSIPQFAGTPKKILRWGSDGLAILTSTAAPGNGQFTIYRINGAFVTSPAPQ